MNELNLFNQPFNGSDYDHKLDFYRLSGQILRIFDCMKDGKFRTLPEIEQITNDGQASISAQLRHLRKDRFGNHTILKQRRGEATNGLWEYKLEVNQSSNGYTP